MSALSRDCAAAMLETIPAVMRIIREEMRSHRLAGMTVPQLRVLGFLDRCGPVTLSGVAGHVGVTPPTMSRMVQSLVEAGFVLRGGGSPDRRTVCLEISARGRRVLRTARRATVGHLAKKIELMRANEVGCIREAMSLLRVLAPDQRQRGSSKK